MSAHVKIGIIAGTGLDNKDLLHERTTKTVSTPYGAPSSELVMGKMAGTDVVLLFRHGRGHCLNPTKVNYRANLWALKEAGCTHIIASNAVGSLREEIKPGQFVFIDNLIDRTTKRESTFFDHTCELMSGVCHIPSANPFCADMRRVLADCATHLNIPFHPKGTIVVIEGPRFSTRAESELFRSWKADVIGMTTNPEVFLARELGLCYASICMATDYDCWHEEVGQVEVSMVMETMKKNAENATRLLLEFLPRVRMDPQCVCRTYASTSKM